MKTVQMEKGIKEAMALSSRIVSKFNRIDKQRRDFGTGELLSRSEIHFIVYVYENGLNNVTELAAKLGVTKGAVSQMHNKLEKKGYIRRLKSPDNDKNILLALTEKGKTASGGHERFHNDLISKFEGLTEKDLQIYMDIMQKVESFADTCLAKKG